MRKERYRVVALIGLMIICLTGCNEVDQKTIKEDLANRLVVEEADVAATANKTEPGELEYSLVMKDKKKVNVKAQIASYALDSYDVYKTERNEKSDESIKKLCDTIFDSNTVEVIIPKGACSITQKEEYRERFLADAEKICEEQELSILNMKREVINGCTILMSNMNNEFRPDYDEFLNQTLEEGKMLYEIAPGVKSCFVLGDIDGKKWLLSDMDLSPDEGYDEITATTLMRYDDCRVKTMLILDTDEKIESYIGTPDYSAANDMLQKLGATDFDLAYVCKVRLGSDYTNNTDVGYVYDFARRVGDYNQIYMDNAVARREKKNALSAQNIIRVVVIDGDVVYAQMYSNGDVLEKVDNDGELLDIEAADAIFREKFVEVYDDSEIYSQTIYIDRVELGYITIDSDDNGQLYVPAWVYYQSDTSEFEDKNAVMAINAVNGDVIQFTRWNTGIIW